ncbi:unnamed protein product [Caenorhabditis bovis]|uniref:Uncharacterized protein n=1 Tax=Caenorhabditis bovis TaxID=2654633 RepID=A0A8S1ESS0_9PELO|nr:unnamed protein product [Caenorhabditis bovis]
MESTSKTKAAARAEYKEKIKNLSDNLADQEVIIDDLQATLAEKRATVPEKVLQRSVEEKMVLLEHYMEHSIPLKETLSTPDGARLKAEITSHGEAEMANLKDFTELVELTSNQQQRLEDIKEMIQATLGKLEIMYDLYF